MKAKSYVDKEGHARELDEQFFKEARRGRPPLPKEERKVKVTMMLDADIVDSYKSGGKGWQTRVNRDLRGMIKAGAPAKQN
ncbi:MAG: BrnA antitoxin family protein [Sneathiella sp.]